jgi:sugar-specific transcriptional regulator TrmB
VLDTLARVGLTKPEALLYIYLAKKGPQPEKELTFELRTTHRELCRTLKNLEDKGFVTSKTEKQTIFIAVPFEKVLDNILEAQTEETKRIEQDKESFFSNLKS